MEGEFISARLQQIERAIAANSALLETAKFSFHTDDLIFSPGPVNGGAIYPVQVAGDHIESHLHGPVNTLRKETLN